MKKAILSALLIIAMFGIAEFRPVPATADAGDHPRIVAAIHQLQDAIDYLHKAPGTFGGHKADAIRACQNAVAQLQAALAYKANH